MPSETVSKINLVDLAGRLAKSFYNFFVVFIGSCGKLSCPEEPVLEVCSKSLCLLLVREQMRLEQLVKG